MIDHIVGFAVRHRWLVVAAAVAFAAFGVHEYRRLPIDAVPRC